MGQLQNIAKSRTARLQRLHCVFQAVLSRPALDEIAQKRIARAQGKKSQRRNLFFRAGRKSLRSTLWNDPVDDLKGSPISADRQKLPIAAAVGFARNASSIARGASLRGLDRNSRTAQALQRRSHAVCAATTTRRRINNGKKSLVHSLALGR